MQVVTTGRTLDAVHVQLRSQLPLIGDGGNKTHWFQIAKCGHWKGYPGGEFGFDEASFDRIIANFEAQANPVPLTYEHPDKESGQPVPAAGWIHKLERRGDQLWAMAEFTKRASEMVRAGEYRWPSVVVVAESIDRVSGEPIGHELIECALTNTPFIDGMTAIRFSRVPARGQEGFKMNIQEKLAKLRAELELDDKAGVEQMVKALQAYDSLHQAVSGKPDAPSDSGDAMDIAASSDHPDAPEAIELADGAEPPSEEMPADEQTAMAEQVAALLTELSGTDLAGTLAILQERAEEFQALFAGAPEDGMAAEEAVAASREFAKNRIAALSRKLEDGDKKVVELSKRISELEFEKVERRIDDAIAAGHLLDSDRARTIKLARRAPDLLDEFLDDKAANPAVPTGKKVSAATPNVADDGSDIDPELLAQHLNAVKLSVKDEARAKKLAIDAARKSMSRRAQA